MIAHIKTHTVKTLTNGQYRAHLRGIFWLGDYSTYALAAKSIRLAEHLINIGQPEKWFYDGGASASESTHTEIVNEFYRDDLFGPSNPLSEDHVRRAILPGDGSFCVSGFPVVSV